MGDGLIFLAFTVVLFCLIGSLEHSIDPSIGISSLCSSALCEISSVWNNRAALSLEYGEIAAVHNSLNSQDTN